MQKLGTFVYASTAKICIPLVKVFEHIHIGALIQSLIPILDWFLTIVKFWLKSSARNLRNWIPYEISIL